MEAANDESLRDLMRRLLNDPAKKLDMHLVAKQLGVSYRVLMYYFGNDPNRRFPAELLPGFCEIVQDYEPLDFIERQAGRVGYRIPPVSQSEAAQMLNIGQLAKESTEAIAALYRTIEHGIVEKREAAKAIAELDDAIRQCVRLRHWLKENIGAIPQAAPKSKRRP